MIGCIAKATSDTLHMDESEMDDVRWVSRDQLQKAVEDSKRTDTPYQGLQPSCHTEAMLQFYFTWLAHADHLTCQVRILLCFVSCMLAIACVGLLDDTQLVCMLLTERATTGCNAFNLLQEGAQKLQRE